MTASNKARLAMVASAAAAFEAARDALHRAVERAVERGASWAEIGGVLGVSRQAAFQRFGRNQARRNKGGMSEP